MPLQASVGSDGKLTINAPDPPTVERPADEAPAKTDPYVDLSSDGEWIKAEAPAAVQQAAQQVEAALDQGAKSSAADAKEAYVKVVDKKEENKAEKPLVTSLLAFDTKVHIESKG